MLEAVKVAAPLGPFCCYEAEWGGERHHVCCCSWGSACGIWFRVHGVLGQEVRKNLKWVLVWTPLKIKIYGFCLIIVFTQFGFDSCIAGPPPTTKGFFNRQKLTKKLEGGTSANEGIFRR
jgi:hypothetical protein